MAPLVGDGRGIPEFAMCRARDEPGPFRREVGGPVIGPSNPSRIATGPNAPLRLQARIGHSIHEIDSIVQIEVRDLPVAAEPHLPLRPIHAREVIVAGWELSGSLRRDEVRALEGDPDHGETGRGWLTILICNPTRRWRRRGGRVRVRQFDHETGPNEPDLQTAGPDIIPDLGRGHLAPVLDDVAAEPPKGRTIGHRRSRGTLLGAKRPGAVRVSDDEEWSGEQQQADDQETPSARHPEPTARFGGGRVHWPVPSRPLDMNDIERFSNGIDPEIHEPNRRKTKGERG